MPDMPDVDLFMRSSGEQRTSNFLLWESAYAEFVFLDTLWPDFSRADLWRAIELYLDRDRRFGGAVDRPTPPLRRFRSLCRQDHARTRNTCRATWLSPDMTDAIKIDVWSDIACPWCYIGKRNLENGLAAGIRR